MLSQLITESLGEGWITHLDQLRELEKFAADENFLSSLAKIKRSNKGQLANWTKKNLGLSLNPDAIFDIQVKRLHEYKRQLLLALYIIVFYNRLLSDPTYDPVPRNFMVNGALTIGTLDGANVEIHDEVGDDTTIP